MKNYILILSLVAFTGCAWLTSHQDQLLKLGGDVAGIAANYAANGNVNYAQAIPLALDSIALFRKTEPVNTSQLSTQIAKTVSDFTNGDAKTTGQRIAAAVTDGLPAVITGAQAVGLLSQASVQADAGVQSVVANP